jgi:DsbE subfamily thiol:disulfide oxidoreductase
VDGRSGIRTEDLRGKVTLVNFFASWCIPCREEHPVLPQVAQAGITLVGISYKDRPEDAKAWLAQFGNSYAAVGADLYGRTGIDFGVYGVPESYLIDKKGIIRRKWTGPLTPDSVRNEVIPLAEKLAK